MKLKSFGCSFIFGSDLADDGRDGPCATPSQYTWPANLAKHYSLEYECVARPGSGNMQIAERVLTHAADPDPSFYVIGWTWIDRFDYTNSNMNKEPRNTKGHNWRTIMPVDDDKVADFYYRGLHSEYRDKLASLMCIKLVIDTLKQKNIPFFMTYMDHLLFDSQWHTTPAVTDLQDYVRPYMNLFGDQNFLEWSRKNDFEISATSHPLEAAHRAAADYMITVFDKQNIIDLTQ
jgi:hypothetical protein